MTKADDGREEESEITDNEALTVITEALRQIAPEADLAHVDADGLLQDELDIDSMDFLNLVTEVQARTGLEIPDRDFGLVATVRGFVDYLVTGAPRP